MESKRQEQASRSKSDDIVAPMKTLAQFDSDILVGTLVWGKFKDWPWWPGLIVTNADVGWSISKRKNSYCILWLGPNKTASTISTDKLSDFLDQNLNSLMDQLIGVEEEQAICEALRGLLSQVLDDKELEGNISIQEMKSLAVQIEIEREEVNGRKPVVLESTSFWFKRAIDSLRSAGAVEEGSPGIGPLGFITPDYAEFAVSALKYSYIKKTEEEATPPPPRKKKALLVPSKSKMKLQCQKRSTDHCSKPDCKIQCICCADPRRKRKVPERFSEFHLMDKGGDSPPSKKVGKKFAHRGALTNKFGAVGGAFEMEKFLEDEQFLRLELPKLVEEEKARASDDDIDLTIRTSRGGHRKIQLVAWIRIRSLYRSGKIHIRVRSRNRSSAPIPLVVKPTDVFAAHDNACDILAIKDESYLSNVVKKLLGPTEETSLYAFLLCDGLNWRLIGSFNPESYTPQLLKPEEIAPKSLPLPGSSGGRMKPRNKMTPSAVMPEVILEEYSLSEEYESELSTSGEKRL